jgi:hypothetical protein
VVESIDLEYLAFALYFHHLLNYVNCTRMLGTKCISYFVSSPLNGQLLCGKVGFTPVQPGLNRKVNRDRVGR